MLYRADFHYGEGDVSMYRHLWQKTQSLALKAAKVFFMSHVCAMEFARARPCLSNFVSSFSRGASRCFIDRHR